MTKELFRSILETKPSLQGLAGSDFEDLLTSYASQMSESEKLETEQIHNEQFIKTAILRESILARAEAKNYIPRKPTPTKQEIEITNNGDQPVTIPWRQPLLTDDGIPVVVYKSFTIQPGETLTKSILQLEKEVKTFVATGSTYEEIDLGGVEDGIYKIAEFSIEIDGALWSQRQNFINTDNESKVYHEFYSFLDATGVRFGNGTFGLIPESEAIIEVAIWQTQGASIALIPDLELSLVGDLLDYGSNQADLTIMTGVIETNGLPQEPLAEIKAGVLSQTQVGLIVVRNADFEFVLNKNFPELEYLKVWGERENKTKYGWSTDHINRLDFAFLLQDDTQEEAVATAIIDFIDNTVRPNNIAPNKITLIQKTFQVVVTGKIDRKYNLSSVQSALQTVLLDKYGQFKNKRIAVNSTEIIKEIIDANYFEDTQPHINRAEKPYFDIAITGDNVAAFYNEYVYLDSVDTAGIDYVPQT